ncbi:GNAT family N-acetyltransferase [Clostridium sp. HBUAS56017]|uniref:GNAT family N-acetyltransferase n=1 Tax=Clostridium sp. HBUAS56017 TaxID=2571128 RepID=UPI0011779837|nr:GNAT family N-acetyltransferase [Clostridium sp. HBUAS56017]
MKIEIIKMEKYHWENVKDIYFQGISTNIATFQRSVPTFQEWDSSHIKECRLVASFGEKVLGWTALSKVSSRCVYNGVAEVSIYIGEEFRGKGVGKALLNALIKESEENGFWTLQSGIIRENVKSIELHKMCGFRELGIREKVARMSNGVWHDVVLMERRSAVTGIN